MLNQYPSWRFHASLPSKVVNDEAEDAALGKGWYKSPADVMPDVTAEPIPPPRKPTPHTVDEETSPKKKGK